MNDEILTDKNKEVLEVEDVPGETKEKSRFYWIKHNTINGLKNFVTRHKLFFGISTFTLLICLFLFRAVWHPSVIYLRSNIWMLTIAAPLTLLWAFMFKRSVKKSMKSEKHPKLKTVFKTVLYILIISCVIGVSIKFDPYNYIALYYRYKTLDKVELKQLPTTDHDIIQPFNSVYSLAKESVEDSEDVMFPDLIREGDEYYFSFAIEAAKKYWAQRWHGGVRDVYKIPATKSSVSLSNDNIVKVHFETGENLFLSNNVFTYVIKNFNFWKFFNYQPVDVRYMNNDKGKTVQVVSLIKWNGIFFPWPEFGGVYIIEQNANKDFSGYVEKVLLGGGQWISPENIGNHGYLIGQNIVPYEVSRYVANSFRFQNGFEAPFPGYHKGDIRIADEAKDVNNQPFTTYFNSPAEGEKGKLYHYFGLEPYNPDNQALITSVLYPGDNVGKIYVCRHSELNQRLVGVSTIATKVKDAMKNYEWTESVLPAEKRPWIKDVNGERKFFFKTVIATLKENKTDFIAGNIEVALINLATSNVEFVDAKKPNTWIAQIEESQDDQSQDTDHKEIK